MRRRLKEVFGANICAGPSLEISRDGHIVTSKWYWIYEWITAVITRTGCGVGFDGVGSFSRKTPGIINLKHDSENDSTILPWVG
jgi:hypothetical protein